MFAERYEEDIENWYYNLQDDEDLMKYLCADRYLNDKDRSMSCFHVSLSSCKRLNGRVISGMCIL